jgi:hypothetical protein
MTGKQQNAEARKVFVQTLARDLGITQGLSQRKFQEKVLMGFSKALFVRLVHVGVLKLDQREQFTLAALKVSNALECVPIANKSQFDADCGWKQKQAKSAVFDEILSIFQDPEQPSVDETTETSE